MTREASPSVVIPSILIVDNEVANLQLLAGMLRERGYEPRPARSGKLALAAAEADPPDLILLDINMPEMSGYEVCQRIKADASLKDIPILFISASTETIDKVKAFSMGAVDYITKPFQVEEVYARVENHLGLRQLQNEVERYSHHLEELVQDQIKEIAMSQMATIFALSKLAESRDSDTGLHLERVRIYCRALAEEMRSTQRYGTIITKNYIDDLYHAAPLHDIGKVGIPDRILLKPGKLSAEEFELMKCHTKIGAETLRSVQLEYPGNAFIKLGIEIAQSHHEKWDGSGYPQGLAGEAIPLSARITAVADIYDALRSKRKYKPALSHSKATEIIFMSSGTHLDPAVVEVFRSLANEFAAVRARMKK